VIDSTCREPEMLHLFYIKDIKNYNGKIRHIPIIKKHFKAIQFRKYLLAMELQVTGLLYTFRRIL
jgi:hypothetical protein